MGVTTIHREASVGAVVAHIVVYGGHVTPPWEYPLTLTTPPEGLGAREQNNRTAGRHQ